MYVVVVEIVVGRCVKVIFYIVGVFDVVGCVGVVFEFVKDCVMWFVYYLG